MMRLRLVLVAGLLAACTHAGTTKSTTPTTTGQKGPTKVVALDPINIDVTKGPGGDTAQAYDAKSLLDQGNDALMRKRYDDAIASFEHLEKDFPDSNLYLAAVYNEGLALEGRRDWPAAQAKYQQVVDKLGPTSKDALDALFRLGVVFSAQGQYDQADKTYEQILDRNDLSDDDRVEALAREGAALVEEADYTGAEDVLRSALDYSRKVNGGSDDDRSANEEEGGYFAAMCQYELAEITHRQFRAISLRYPQEQMALDLDQKSQLFLLARDRYLKVLKYKDPYWEGAANYQIGLMYKEFWDAWVRVPVPASLDPEAAKKYVEYVNTEPKLHSLLEQSLVYHQHNAVLGRSTETASVWTDASAREASVVAGILDDIKSGKYLQPGTPPPSAPPVTEAPDLPPQAGSTYVPTRPDL